jgi:hypothetical protein
MPFTARFISLLKFHLLRGDSCETYAARAMFLKQQQQEHRND